MRKKTSLPQLKAASRGQSLVELGITVLALLILLSGSVDFGMAFFSYIALHDAAQEGALYGSLDPDDNAGIETRVRQTSTQPVNLADEDLVDVEIFKSDPACAGGWVMVSVYYEFPLMMPFFGGATVPLRATTTDTILRPACP
ncbi:MAG: pilus assembly protein [Chloroflexi bacterium]|nr:pilus assembly protein [Chloroflexota bacterium]